MELSLQTSFMHLESYGALLWGVSALGFSVWQRIEQDPEKLKRAEVVLPPWWSGTRGANPWGSGVGS